MKRLLFVLLLSGALGYGASTASWEMSNYQDFVRGKFQGVSLTRDGRIMLAGSLETVFSSDQPSIWSVAQAPDGVLYLGTGHRGRVFRVDGPGKNSVLWTSPQPEVFAVAVGPDGAVYAGTSPDGKVYRIQNGTATEYFAPEAKYIWSLAFGKDGALYVGTGDQGKIFRVTAPGKGELYYETGQSHVTSLAIDQGGR
jgi:glucose/arabinose dehydrogenase